MNPKAPRKKSFPFLIVISAVLGGFAGYMIGAARSPEDTKAAIGIEQVRTLPARNMLQTEPLKTTPQTEPETEREEDLNHELEEKKKK